MGLLSIFQRKKQTAAKPAKSRAKAAVRPAPPSADNAEALRDARIRARRRLMGAAVLLLVGVVGFHLVFETQPRPAVPADLPIEIPSRTGGTTLDTPASPPVQHRGRGPSAATAHALEAASATMSGASPAGRESVPAPSAGQVDGGASSMGALSAALSPSAVHAGEASAALGASSGAQSSAYARSRAAAETAPSRPAAVLAHEAPASHETAAASLPAAAASRTTPAAHAQSLPAHQPDSASPGAKPPVARPPIAKPAEAKPAESAETGRFVVQIGAFAEDAKMHEVRGKVDRLGLKTYTQAVDTPAGKRVRVRVGPFPSKAEADRAAAKIKGDGLPAAVLAL